MSEKLGKEELLYGLECFYWHKEQIKPLVDEQKIYNKIRRIIEEYFDRPKVTREDLKAFIDEHFGLAVEAMRDQKALYPAVVEVFTTALKIFLKSKNITVED